MQVLGTFILSSLLLRGSCSQRMMMAFLITWMKMGKPLNLIGKCFISITKKFLSAFKVTYKECCLISFSSRYMPIIPMVLVNGCEGIGTGWSTFIPNYNPRDIVANIRRLLNGEMMEPMNPWYRGFKGTIEKGASKEAGCSYTVNGVINEVNETTLRITELPIRRWTDDYKAFLNSVTEGNRDENGNLPKDPFIKVILISNRCTVQCFYFLMDNVLVAGFQKVW